MDNVNRPAHYTQGKIECIDAIKASMGEVSNEKFTSFLKGNCLKYLWRTDLKGGLEDLQKAQWYLTRWIAEIEALQAEGQKAGAEWQGDIHIEKSDR